MSRSTASQPRRDQRSLFEMHLRTRMMLAFMIVCVFMVMFVGASIWRTDILNKDAQRIADVDSPFAVGVTRLHALLEATQVGVLGAALSGSMSESSRDGQWERTWRLVREAQDDLAPLALAWFHLDRGNRWRDVEGLVDSLRANQDRLWDAGAQNEPLGPSLIEVHASLTQLRALLGTLERNYGGSGVYAQIGVTLQTDREAVGSHANFLSAVLWAMLIAGVMISSVVVRSISKSITDPVEEISEAIGRLALGEHDVAIPRTGGILEFGALADAVAVFKTNSEQIIEVTEGIAGGDYSQEVMLRGERDALAVSINKMVETLREIVKQAVVISEGDYSIVVKPKSHHDDLGAALFDMTRTLREVSEAVELIAVGDFSRQVRIKGENDILAVGVNSLVDHFHMVAGQANRIADGDFSHAVAPLSERDELGRALSRMTDSLRGKDEENKRHSWLKSAQAEIIEKLTGDHSLETLCSRAIGYIAWYLEAQVGVLYVSQREGSLTLMGRYACSENDTVPEEIEFGSGLVGECALGRETITVSGIEEESLHVNSALTRGKPQHIIVVPVLLRGQIKGVIELCSVTEFTREHRQLVEAIAKGLAIAVTSAESREETRSLLVRSQELSKELQARQDELERKNIELSDQTRALVRSEVRLRRRTNELQDANDELDRKKTDLEQQSKELEQSSRCKSEFLANVSHELRTPLNSLLILADVLGQDRENNLSVQQLESVKVIHDGGKELLTLINDILDLSKVEAGKLDLHVERVSLADSLEGLRRQFQIIADEKSIGLRVLLESDSPPEVWSDALRMEQILKNLLSNAIKFTNEGEVCLRVGRASANSHGDIASMGDEVIVFSVEDTGIGVPDHDQEAIFESFQQADGSTRRSYGGTGLGLTISRQLAGLLGGEVRLVRSDSSGSLFAMLLPVGQPSEDEGTAKVTLAPVEAGLETSGRSVESSSTDASEEASQSAIDAHACNTPTVEVGSTTGSAPRVHRRLSGRTVLLADDDLRSAFALSKLLRDQGMEVALADNGAHALERLHSGASYDLVLMDLIMPVMDGLTAIEIMRKVEDFVDVPVIALAAEAQSPDQQRSLELGANAFMAKPVDIEQLLTEMEKWV